MSAPCLPFSQLRGTKRGVGVDNGKAIKRAFIYGTKLQAHHAQFIITHDVI